MKAHSWVVSRLLAVSGFFCLLAFAVPGTAQAQMAPKGCSPDFCGGLQSTYYGGPVYNETGYYGGRAYAENCDCSEDMGGPAGIPQNFIVFFDFDRATLTAAGRGVIKSAVDYARTNGKATLDLNGYTDLAGSDAYNLRLSKRRADSVAAYMASLGVPRSELVEAWFGKQNPRVPTPDGVREPQNRRVEIIMP